MATLKSSLRTRLSPVTKDGASSGPGNMNYDLDMPPYVQEMADWLKKWGLRAARPTPANLASASRFNDSDRPLVRSPHWEEK